MCAAVCYRRKAEHVQKQVKPVQEGGDYPWLLGSGGKFAFQTGVSVVRDW